MPPKGIKRFCHSNILSDGKILFIFKKAAEIGFNKVCLASGEPFVRGNISDLVERLADISKLTDLSMTTNGRESTYLLVF